MTTLLLSQRHTPDDQALWRAATKRGWTVERARGIRVPDVDDDEIVIYVESLFAPAIAKAMHRRLLDPPEDWLVRLPEKYRHRKVRLTTLGEARAILEPAFVKPPNDKSFEARVYSSGAQLPVEFDDAMSVLVSEPVRWQNEYRCFLLGGSVKTISPYLINGELAKLVDYQAPEAEPNEATAFAECVAFDALASVPNAIVLDVGRLENGQWAVVEANGAWGSGIYGCDPDAVLDVLRMATLPLEK